jgi:hypothetical protein
VKVAKTKEKTLFIGRVPVTAENLVTLHEFIALIIITFNGVVFCQFRKKR